MKRRSRLHPKSHQLHLGCRLRITIQFIHQRLKFCAVSNLISILTGIKINQQYSISHTLKWCKSLSSFCLAPKVNISSQISFKEWELHGWHQDVPNRGQEGKGVAPLSPDMLSEGWQMQNFLDENLRFFGCLF